MSMPARSRTRGIALIAYLIALVVMVGAVTLGASMLLPIVFTAVLVVASLRSRMPLAAAVALFLVTAVWTTVLVFIAAFYTGVPALPLVLATVVVASSLCAIHLYRRGTSFSGADAVDLGFAGGGSLIWVAVTLASAVIPSGSPLSWSMTGDAANNILFARRLIEDGGIALGAGQNPVPLTAALIALFMLPTAGKSPSVGDQIVALSQMWSFGIVVACLMSGAFVLALVKKRTAISLLAVVVTSLVPLSWVLLAGPILLGFVNFHLTLALILASLIALVSARGAPVTSFVVISLSVAAVLALWAPLAGIPGTALLVLVVAHRRSLVRARGVRLVLIIVAAVQPLAFFLTLSLPSLLGSSDLLQEALGAVFEFRKTLAVVLLLSTVAFGAFHIRATRSWDMGNVLLAVVGGGGVCLGALLWLRRNEDSLWSYYQLKYLWLLMAILMIVSVAAGLTLAAVISRSAARSAFAAASVLIVTVGVGEYARATVPTFSNDPAAMRSPLVSMLTGAFFSVGEGDRVFHRVDELTSGEDSSILWRSGDPDEDWILFWLIQMSAESVGDVDLRTFAYYHDSSSIDDLCTIRQLMGPPVTVVTADPEVVSGAALSCPDLGPVVLTR